MSKKARKHSPKNHRKNEAYNGSLRSLMFEVTGLKDETEFTYGAQLKHLQRIMSDLKSWVGNDQKIKIAPEHKESMVYLLKAFMPDGKSRSLYEKLRSGTPLLEEEQIELTNLFTKAVQLQEEGFDKEILIEKAQAQEEFMSLMEEIFKTIGEDIQIVDKVIYHKHKIQLLIKYQEILNKSLEHWRSEVSDMLLNEKLRLETTELLFAEGYTAQDILEDTEDKLLDEVWESLIKRDSLQFIKSLEMLDKDTKETENN